MTMFICIHSGLNAYNGGMKFRFLFSVAILAVMVSCTPQQAVTIPESPESSQGEANASDFFLASGGLQFVEFYSDI